MESKDNLDAFFSSRKCSPFGVVPREGFQSRLQSDNPRDYELDAFPTAAQRATYFRTNGGGDNENGDQAHQKSGRRLGVRLRARQVLCNNCKNICNEKGENVQQNGGRRKRNGDSSNNTKLRRPSAKDLALIQKCSLVPKIRRLEQREIDKYSSDGSNLSGDDSKSPYAKSPLAGDLEGPLQAEKQPLRIKFSNLLNNRTEESSPVIESNDDNDLISASASEGCSGGRIMRKNRNTALGAMEDLWDESVFEDARSSSQEESASAAEDRLMPPPAKKRRRTTPPPATLATPALKIMFGGSTRGKGSATVMNIPAKATGRGSGESSQSDAENSAAALDRLAQAKAARKALKRARKEAQRRGAGLISPRASPRASPARVGALTSPMYYKGGRSPLAQSPRLACPSPFAHPSGGYTLPRRSPAYSVALPSSVAVKRHHHKKKKHKRKKDSRQEAYSQKEHKRIEQQQVDESEVLSDQKVDSCVMDNGKTLCVGNVVWAMEQQGGQDTGSWWPGKVTGSWWPGKVSD